jgi:hypothetical protein
VTLPIVGRTATDVVIVHTSMDRDDQTTQLANHEAIAPVAVGIDIVVEDLDRALELLVGIIGLPLVSMGPSAAVAGRAAVIDAGGIAISLLEPAVVGPGPILAERTPRLSQIVLAAPPDTAELLAGRLVDVGLAVAQRDPATFFVSPESTRGALGVTTAVVVTTVHDNVHDNDPADVE